MAKRGTSRGLFMFTCAIAAGLLSAPPGAAAAERVGEAVRISVQVQGGGGALAAGDAIHRDETIRSNASGTGAFLFADGTKLAVGPNSSIVIDDYVYKSGKAGKLAIGATKGTLRWISGTSDHSAYRIETPSGTLGVRGTAFDVYVGPDGLTAVTLLTGAAEFCNARGCRSLTRRCDVLIARPNGDITEPRGIVRDLGIGRRGEDVFPFLAGKAWLPRGFKAGSRCAGLGGSISGPGRNGLAPDRSTPEPSPSPPRGNGGSPNTGGGTQRPN
jgi:hypothetical protein